MIHRICSWDIPSLVLYHMLLLEIFTSVWTKPFHKAWERFPVGLDVTSLCSLFPHGEIRGKPSICISCSVYHAVITRIWKSCDYLTIDGNIQERACVEITGLLAWLVAFKGEGLKFPVSLCEKIIVAINVKTVHSFMSFCCSVERFTAYTFLYGCLQ